MSTTASTAVMWFRRDLRLADHKALTAAAATHRHVVPLFVLDPTLLARAGAVRQSYLFEALRSLDASLDGRLVVRSGDPVEVLVAIAAETGVRDVYVSRDAGPTGRSRDRRVATALSERGIAFHGVGSPYAVDPGTIVKADGGPYAVFTPFRRAWERHGWPAPLAVPDVEWRGRPDVAGEPIPRGPQVAIALPAADEAAVEQQWSRFRAGPVDAYASDRDRPGIAGTSRLSAALHVGLIHPRRLLADLDDTEGHRVFASELAWRDFYADVIMRHPRSAWRDLDDRLSAILVDTDAAARRRFDRWCRGETGYPIVDAGMRELASTGWMHNRVRMITASFLIKDLHLPWQWGARFFLDHLVDGDVASNNHGWQWVAGTGTDAAPYFRVFNPVAQGERFDPDGAYVRHWIPALTDLPDRYVHAPWTRDGDGAPEGYVAPMVDHGVERAETLARYQAAKRS